MLQSFFLEGIWKRKFLGKPCIIHPLSRKSPGNMWTFEKKPGFLVDKNTKASDSLFFCWGEKKLFLSIFVATQFNMYHISGLFLYVFYEKYKMYTLNEEHII